jgi:hypothetical protein
MPFKPGQSGNPGGRPKGWAEVNALARQHTAAAIEALVKSLGDRLPVLARSVEIEYIAIDLVCRIQCCNCKDRSLLIPRFRWRWYAGPIPSSGVPAARAHG